MSIEAARRLDDSIRAEFAINQGSFASRVAGADDEFIAAGGEARWSRGGVPMWEGRAVLVARYAPDLGVFRWWWANQSAGSAPASKLDRAYAEAQTRGLDIVQSRQIVLDDAADAEMLARLVSHLARAHGVIGRVDGTQHLFYALFESAESMERGLQAPARRSSAAYQSYVPNMAHSIPPPGVAPRAESAPRTEAPTTGSEKPIREPSLDLLVPLAQAAGVAIRKGLGPVFQDAVLVVIVDTSREKARFYVQLVAVSSYGVLEAPNTTRELHDAVMSMIVADSKAGNGRWHKLVLRVHPSGQNVSVGRVEIS
jgi:hypothetical protein